MSETATAPRLEDLPVAREASALHEIRRWVSARLGLQFDRQLQGFETRVLAFCRGRRIAPEHLLDGLRSERPSLVVGVAESLSTNHTAFFREPEAFDLFRDKIVATLPQSDTIRIWSAAASSGEEAYSIAFTMRDLLGADARKRVRILGTDLSQRQIRCAEAARYPRFLHPSDGAFTSRFLVEDGDIVVPPEIRSMCVFRTLNLTRQPWPFAQRFHVIFLRNVLYYFDRDAQRRVLEACYDATVPGGWLVTSLTEPLIDLRTRWEHVCPGIQRRT